MSARPKPPPDPRRPPVPAEDHLELRVRLARRDGQVPFESEVRVPLRPGQEWRPAVDAWFAMMESAVEVHKALGLGAEVQERIE